MNCLFGFKWGPLQVERTAHIKGRGYILTVKTAKQRLELFITEKGSKIMILTNKKLTKPDRE